MPSFAKSLTFAALTAAAATVGLTPGTGVPRAHASSSGIPQPPCAPLDAFAVKALRARVKHEYRPSFLGCTLAIDVATCAPPVRPTEIVYVEGWGHSMGPTLTITSLRREGDGVAVTRLMIVRSGSTIAKYAGERSDGVKLLRGIVTGEKIEQAWSVAEVAHALTLREVHPEGFSTGGWMSSSDFTASVTLVSPGAVVDRAFVGYSANDTQLESLPLSVATAGLDAAIPLGTLSPAPLDGDARALFVTELSRRAPELDQQFHWWVREAFVRASGDAGDASLVPLLRRYLVSSDPSSGERTRVAAISALSVLTGDDRRFDAKGVERPVDVVAAEYRKMLGSK